MFGLSYTWCVSLPGRYPFLGISLCHYPEATLLLTLQRPRHCRLIHPLHPCYLRHREHLRENALRLADIKKPLDAFLVTLLPERWVSDTWIR